MIITLFTSSKHENSKRNTEPLPWAYAEASQLQDGVAISFWLISSARGGIVLSVCHAHAHGFSVFISFKVIFCFNLIQ